MNLPGIGVLVGGLWVANIYYWGFNQYIIQRTLAAKSLREAQKGILLAAFLKLLIPFIVVVPGIAAYVMVNDPAIMARLGVSAMENLPGLGTADRAYPWLLHFLPAGLKGLAFAALAAAIVSSLASMLNSTSTIFTMDIYKQYINKNANDKTTVNVGRLSGGIAFHAARYVSFTHSSASGSHFKMLFAILLQVEPYFAASSAIACSVRAKNSSMIFTSSNKVSTSSPMYYGSGGQSYRSEGKFHTFIIVHCNSIFYRLSKIVWHQSRSLGSLKIWSFGFGRVARSRGGVTKN